MIWNFIVLSRGKMKRYESWKIQLRFYGKCMMMNILTEIGKEI